MAGKLKAAAGLACLQAKKYKQAARRFTEVGTRHYVLSKTLRRTSTQVASLREPLYPEAA